MPLVNSFNVTKSTKRFKKNQRVWVKLTKDNYLVIRHKWRGKEGTLLV